MKIIKNIKLYNWKQFGMVDIDFHPNLTVITGANGAGKSSILQLLGRFLPFPWAYEELAVPLSGKSGSYNTGVKESTNLLPGTNYTVIGNLTYVKNSTNEDMTIAVPVESRDAKYNFSISGDPIISGIFIPSHGTPFTYGQISPAKTNLISRNTALGMFIGSKQGRLLGYDYNNPEPLTTLKEAIFNFAFHGSSNLFMLQDEYALSMIKGFIDLLKRLLPPTLGFQNIELRNGELVFLTNTGTFLIDSVSGGIGAILDIAWQIYLSDEGQHFHVFIDEPENHLHPSLQRALMPNLIEAFPNAQFIIATHNPLMINSVQDSHIYVLKYNEQNLVVSDKLDMINKAGNATKILREVLGVPVTLPTWVEEQLVKITNRFNTNLTANQYIELKQDLQNIGLSEHLPYALSLIKDGEHHH